ncbi:uncharacterized membrane protein YhaH (DUF805 family) [Litoreibacter ponti]|uniref:Uncharacterized membrane protein YhaH (DUF805 family) n=1 Tax=Litoreibacter ponti TaxID=1510457 RepID=A0A2T6BFT1_9RHOB|nr:DUF805 domain-containing protein [Litoreibacter ponti]PTX54922.1 uncharacterized membrane protein YhaH (DUF805 family) [Litoreibacter ponti]
MRPFAALKSCLLKSFRWRGRAPRSEFWWFLLVYSAGFWVALIETLMRPDEVVTEDDVGPMLIYMMVLFLPMLAVMARRLHDKGLTAWLMFLLLLPFGQVALLILAALPGDRGPNAHGPDPLGREREALTYGSSRIPVVRDDD